MFLERAVLKISGNSHKNAGGGVCLYIAGIYPASLLITNSSTKDAFVGIPNISRIAVP